MTQSQLNIKAKLDSHVYACVTTLVEELLDKNVLDHEDFPVDYQAGFDVSYTLLKLTPDMPIFDRVVSRDLRDDNKDGVYLWFSDDLSDNSWYADSDFFATETEAIKHCVEHNNIDCPPIETLEYWQVSPWLADQLERKGEITISLYGLFIWCRGGSGQSVHLDSCMQDIFKDQ